MKYSVVLPVYNVERELEKSIESLINQNYLDVEFIFVDDGSVDNSANIIRNYEKEDKRIKLFTKKNEGTGLTRNFGLDKSLGEYIFFMDPDDWIEPDFFKKIDFFLMGKEVDVVLFGYNTYENSKIVRRTRNETTSTFIGNTNIIKNYDMIFYSNTLFEVWNKIYRKEFIMSNQLLFTPIRRGQDAIFNLELFSLVGSLICIPEYLYNYVSKRKNSAQNSNLECRILDNINIAERFDSFVENNNIKRKYFYDYLINIFFEDYKLKKSKNNINQEYYSNYAKYRSMVFSMKFSEIKELKLKQILKWLILKYFNN